MRTPQPNTSDSMEKPWKTTFRCQASGDSNPLLNRTKWRGVDCGHSAAKHFRFHEKTLGNDVPLSDLRRLEPLLNETEGRGLDCTHSAAKHSGFSGKTFRNDVPLLES